MPHRIRVLTAAAVIAAFAAPAAASAASPGSTPAGVSTATGPTAPQESQLAGGPKEPVGCADQGVMISQAPTGRLTITAVPPMVSRTTDRQIVLVPPAIDPPSKGGETESDDNLDDELNDHNELMDRLFDMLNRLSDTQDETARRVGG